MPLAMSRGRWMLYGATGYTGVLLAEEAVARGHRPILAGRSEDKLRPLAERLGLDWKSFGLDDAKAVASAIDECQLVFHAAGPFVETSEAMVNACLAVGAHYVDITGEIPVFQRSLARDAEARQKNIVIMSGAGFDVVPTDCLAKYVSDAVPDATELEIAIDARGGPSAGTLKSLLELVPRGNFVRRNGALVSCPLGALAKTIRFSHAERFAMAIPWGDLETAFHTTQIPNITTYLAQRQSAVRWVRVAGPAFRAAMSLRTVRNLARNAVTARMHGPTAEVRRRTSSYVWARAANRDGVAREAWLQTAEGYTFTASAGVHVVERLLGGSWSGALTPAQAFGADFVLEVRGSRRMDRLTA